MMWWMSSMRPAALTSAVLPDPPPLVLDAAGDAAVGGAAPGPEEPEPSAPSVGAK